MFGYKFIKVEKLEHLQNDLVQLKKQLEDKCTRISELEGRVKSLNKIIEDLKTTPKIGPVVPDAVLLTDVAEAPLTRTTKKVSRKSTTRRKVVHKEEN